MQLFFGYVRFRQFSITENSRAIMSNFLSNMNRDMARNGLNGAKNVFVRYTMGDNGKIKAFL